MNIIQFIGGFSRAGIYFLSFVLLIVIGFIDYLTGIEVGFSLFYVIPISIIAGLLKRYEGIIFAVIAALTWEFVELVSGHEFSNHLISAWNTFIRFGFYIIIVYLMHAIKVLLEKERERSLIDPLTQIPNSRAFYEFAEREFKRFSRYGRPIAVAYIDLDNFKSVNDSSGHQEGDRLLHVLAKELEKHVRSTDMAARIGGDEFAVFLTEINESDSKKVINTLRDDIVTLMNVNNWPVTVSIGVVLLYKPTESVLEMIKLADGLMYQVKQGGKNGIRFYVYN